MTDTEEYSLYYELAILPPKGEKIGTGIPYGKNNELEIIKQLFDFANLFDSMSDIEVVSNFQINGTARAKI